MLTTDDRRARYRELCGDNDIQFFSQAWWLDEVAGLDGWDVALVERGGQVHAALPFVVSRRLGMPVVRMPPMTRSLGPWFRDVGGSTASRIGREKELTGELLAQLPSLAQFQQNFVPGLTNTLPWYWQGYRVEVRYTYVLGAGLGEAVLWDGMSHATRKVVRKARERFGLQVGPGDDFELFLSLHRQVFERQDKALPIGEDFLRRLDAAIASHGMRRLYVATDAEGRVHAAAYVVRDTKTAYYLMSGSEQSLRHSGALGLLLWEAIRDASGDGLSFDFEGSMIPGIEQFFRGFGAQQTPYYAVSKTSSRLLLVLDALRACRAV